MWITLGVVGLFILLPIRTWINKVFGNLNIETLKTYDEVCLRFVTDYDQENPVTKREGFLRIMDKQIELETNQEKKRELEQNKAKIAEVSVAQAFS